jgi:CheY-like chemotaxis protein/anti-sigma regulatory factor (Ser/Thr protein kinase)
MGHALVIGRGGPLAAALQAGGSARGHEVRRCSGNVEAVQLLRQHAFDVVVTDTETSIEEDLALVRELTSTRPGVRIIVLAPAATHGDLMAALRAHVFACFTPPFEPGDIVDMLCSALNASDWHDGLELVSGLPHWFTLRVSCHLLTADRLVRFMTEHLNSLLAAERDLLIAAFRELLLNAMEHGAGFDRGKVVEVTAARTARAIVYHVRDPGAGFNRQTLPHAAMSPDPDAVVASALRRSEMGLRPGGLGMLIARTVADELVYNEFGNEVLLVKHLD